MKTNTRVLIVDDKEENLYYLNALLTGHGCTVEQARHGAEALVLARQSPPDLIVSDLLMPVMDGYTLLRHWKADARLKQVPFIVYTATYTEAEDERLALSLGADAFILKPSEPDAFISRVREVQANTLSASPAMPRTQVGDDEVLMKVYSETLIRKLEEKTLQLEETNQILQRDIAERKKVEEALRSTQQQISEQARLLDQTQDAIVVKDLEDRVLYWNKGAERIYGWTAAEVTGRSIGELFSRDKAQLKTAMDALLRRGEWSGELRHVNKSGTQVIMEGRWTLIRDESGAPKSVLAVNTDVTERRRIEAQFLRTQRLESIGTLAGGIAHDLNNLMAPIIMGVGILRQQARDETARKVIDTIEKSAQRGTDLVRQVLSFARGIDGARVPVHLGDVVQDIEAITRTTFPKDITFVADIPKNLRPVIGDPTQINQVLLNLCVNARDAMPNGGRLTISARNIEIDEHYASMDQRVAAGSYVMLSVKDEGCGMPPELLDRVFEPFYTTKQPGLGTGLGLSTVLGIVRSHGGHVNIHSEVDKGSEFKVYLPADAGTTPPVTVDSGSGALPRGAGELILVVDDEDSILGITRHTLESFGYRVVTAVDGADAMGVYAKHKDEIALVLTDMMMPVMDGTALTAALRRIDPGVKIVMATGVSANGSEERAAKAGASHFMAKPYTAEQLLVTLRKLLGKARR